MKQIYIKTVGTEQFPRFLIVEKNGEVYTGKGWSTTEEDACKYAILSEAADECHRLLRADYWDTAHVSHFTFPVQLEVRSEHRISPEALQEWVRRAVDLQISYTQHGNGPDASLVLLTLDVKNLKEVDHVEKGHW